MFSQIVFISFIGGFISLDVMTIWQVMISRPLVTAPIIGWLCGSVETGLIIGVLLELIWINILPLGTVIPPDVSATAIIATAQAVFCKHILPYQSSDVIIVLVIMCAVPLGTVFKKVDIWLRWFNRKFVYLIDRYAEKDNIAGIEYVIHLSILMTLLKNFVFYTVGIYLGIFLVTTITPLLSVGVKEGLRLALVMLPALGFAAVLDIFIMKK